MCEHSHDGVMRATAPEAAACEMHHYQHGGPRLLSPGLAPPVGSLATRLTGLEGKGRLSPPACLLHSSAALAVTEQGITTMCLRNTFRNILPKSNQCPSQVSRALCVTVRVRFMTPAPQDYTLNLLPGSQSQQRAWKCCCRVMSWMALTLPRDMGGEGS